MAVPRLNGWRLIGLIVACGVLASPLLVVVRRPLDNAFIRGERAAQRLGCLGCHGHGGGIGAANPGSDLGRIPPFSLGGAIKSYVQSDAEIREWILYGAPHRLKGKAASPGLIRMPAYEGVVSDPELEDLVVFVRTLAALGRPASLAVERGRQVAAALGCFNCHSFGGRGGPSNPRSFKGYIPPWDGDDFAELVRDEGELRQWILDGEIERLAANPVATYFTYNQVVRMPAYRNVITEEQLGSIMAYIEWLRDESPPVVEHWVEEEVPAFARRVEYGRWLYGAAGCVACHGPDGASEPANANAAGGYVPRVDNLAEKMELFEQRDIDAIVAAIEAGKRLEDLSESPPVVEFEAVLSQYQTYVELILKGAHSRKHDRAGPSPPMAMPAWRKRWNADGGPPSRADIDALIAYLLTLQPSLEAS